MTRVGGSQVASRRGMALGLAVPYLTVPVGLYGLSSGWGAMLLYHAGMLAVLLWAGRSDGRGGARVRALGRGWRLGLGGAGILVCLGAGGALYLLLPAWGAAVGGSDAGAALSTVLRQLGLSGASWAAFGIYYVLVNPVLEELYWRGLWGGPRPGVTGSDVAFGGYHALVLGVLLPGESWVRWGLAVLLASSLVGAGWLWRQVARRAGGLAIPVLTHMAADLSIIVAGHGLAFG